MNKPCIEPRCRNLVGPGVSYCDKHLPSQFGSPDSPPLPPDWHDLRRSILARDGYLCVKCRQRATTVDHIRPRAHGGDHHDSNLQSLCDACNEAKTKHDRR